MTGFGCADLMSSQEMIKHHASTKRRAMGCLAKARA